MTEGLPPGALAAKPAWGLAIDTTRAVLTLACGSAPQSARYQSWDLGRGLSGHLHPLLQGFIDPQDWSELAWIAVVQGPGSFTGTRIGVVTARTLAQQLQVPLFGLSSLAIAVWQRTRSLGGVAGQQVAVTQPGQQGFVYGAIYAVNTGRTPIQVLSADRLYRLEEWQQALAEMPGVNIIVAQDTGVKTDRTERGAAMLAIAAEAWARGERPSWETVLPFYS